MMVCTLEQGGAFVNGSEKTDSEGRGREIRIALVLYGGVSLAVYENGVTRAFFDLVRENGPFKVLLEILDANAVVDVVAGTSAGGINGLFLAAALESGGDFARTAELWRKHGDLGKLMRPVTASQNAVSLLDGESYYQQRLEEAFRTVLTPSADQDFRPGEMDVFITGTNLEGILSTTWDSLGARIDDKTHRTVFRLQHRPGRKILGLGHVDSRSEDTTALQACILASIARITSTFPVAFPPFTLEQLPSHRRDKVKEALERTSGTQPTHHVYVDGGVLDNKPFGPALEAIFYRMPHKLVDRRLFYVEPDPAHLTPLSDEASQRLQNPIRVAVASLSTIPAHESIGEDLEKLKAHNARIRWLKRIKENYLELFRADDSCVGSREWEPSLEIYRRVRIDSLCTLMVSDSGDVPSAKTELKDPVRQHLFQALRRTLLDLTRHEEKAASSIDPPVDWLHLYDVEWHVRCAFYVLYHLYDGLDDAQNSSREDLLAAVRATGRIIKTFKMIRNRLDLVRDTLFERTEGGRHLKSNLLLQALATFLESQNPVWDPLAKNLTAAFGAMDDAVFHRRIQDRDEGPLRSSVLTETALRAWQWSVNLDPKRVEPQAPSGPPQKTILTMVHDVLQEVVRRVSKTGNPIQDFVMLDRAFYPLEFAAGIHELDEIEVVRISPRDAQTGLSAVAPAIKVTGDDLAHFAAFFRRDWRSNDILWGRIDGICQIVRSLLDEGVQDRLWQNRRHLPQAITTESLDEHFSGCPLHEKKALLESWQNLLDTRPPAGCSEEEKAEWLQKLLAFRDRFITAAQYHAVCQELGTLYEDVYFQEMVWGTISDETGVGPHTGETALELRAREKGDQARRAVKDCGSDLQEKALGSQTVVGPKGAVPAHILTEYACQAYLLAWGLLQTALQGHHRLSSFFGRRTPKWLLRTPIAFVYHLVRAQRLEPRSFPILVVGSVAALLACGATGIFFGNLWFVLPIVAALAVMGITVWLKPQKK